MQVHEHIVVKLTEIIERGAPSTRITSLAGVLHEPMQDAEVGDDAGVMGDRANILGRVIGEKEVRIAGDVTGCVGCGEGPAKHFPRNELYSGNHRGVEAVTGKRVAIGPVVA